MSEKRFLPIDTFLKTFITSSPPPSSLEQTRERQASYGLAAPLPQDWTAEEIDLKGVQALELSGPEVQSGAAMIFYHAGGYSAGSAADHAGLAAHLGKSAKMAAYSVDYRLAPEHVFPAAVEDAFQAYIGLQEFLGPDVAIVVAGDSAGGGLAVAVAQLALLRNLIAPVAVYAISPWADMSLTGTTFTTRASYDPILSQPGLTFLKQLYLNGQDPVDPLASPVYGNFTEFPPLRIDVGANEVLLSDSLEITKQASAHGEEVALKVWKDMIHIFSWFYPHLREAVRAIEEAGNWIREKVSGIEQNQ